jgi:hypothetical protein
MKGENPFSRRELVKFFGADLAGAALTDSLTVSEAQRPFNRGSIR